MHFAVSRMKMSVKMTVMFFCIHSLSPRYSWYPDISFLIRFSNAVSFSHRLLSRVTSPEPHVLCVVARGGDGGGGSRFNRLVMRGALGPLLCQLSPGGAAPGGRISVMMGVKQGDSGPWE